MPFLNIPLKTIQAELTDILGVESMPWYDPSEFPVLPGNPYPAPVPREYRWRVTLNISIQQQSSYLTRNPGVYNGQDINVGQWIANSSTGQAWQIITIESKTASQVVAIVQDIYRYNTFRDPFKLGNGSPSYGTYIVFNISDAGLPQIDPIPDSGVSSTFTQNLTSRFEYINLQYDYPLYQAGNTFVVNDVIAVDSLTNQFVLSDDNNRIVIGRVTSISDTIPGWFTINPVQKVVDNLDWLPGNVGDIIYSSTTDPGGLSVIDTNGTQVYIKLRDNTSSVSISQLPGPTSAGNVFQLNGVDVTVSGTGTAADVVSDVNLVSTQTGVVASLDLVPTEVQTNNALLSTTYGEVVIGVLTPAVATINGVSVTFNIPSTNPGYGDYSQAPQIAQAINNASIPNIVADAPTMQVVRITNTAGGPITIVNVSPDQLGVDFAGPNSGSGLALNTPASTAYRITFTAVDARAINFLDVVGSVTSDFGINSVENGIKAVGLYIEEGLRTAKTTVVTNLTQLNALSPLIGDQAYVINSDDGNGNNVNEWSMWLYNGINWVATSTQDSSSTDAKSLELELTTNLAGVYQVGKISTGRRVTLITVEVITPYNAPATLNIGYNVNSVPPGLPNYTGLMTASVIDLTVSGTYTTTTDVLFGVDTDEGDVTVLAEFDPMGATIGQAQIIVSYV